MPVNGDFYKIVDLLNPKERAVVNRVRDFMETEVAPIIEEVAKISGDRLES